MTQMSKGGNVMKDIHIAVYASKDTDIENLTKEDYATFVFNDNNPMIQMFTSGERDMDLYKNHVWSIDLSSKDLMGHCLSESEWKEEYRNGN